MNEQRNSILLDLEGLTERDLLDLKTEIDAEITSIKMQLENARAEKISTGKYADSTWWIKANNALRIKGRQSQQIQTELGSIKSSKRKRVNDRFVEIAKQTLSNEEFVEILKQAQEECQ